MKVLKTILLAGGASVILAAAAQAADLPTKKAPAPAPTNCLADFYSWLYASPTDCTLTMAGVTVYGQVDVGASYQSNGASFGNRYPDSVEYAIGQQGHGSKLQWVDNALSPSNVGIKFTEKLFGDVSLIGDWRIAFNALSLRLLDGPGSLIDANGIPGQLRNSAGSSSYNGAIDNNRAWIGFQSPTIGTLKVGRIYNFYNELQPSYDPTGAAYAFGALGYSSTWSSGLGITETNRYNLGASYVYDYNKMFHAGAGLAIGGYGAQNDAKQLYNFDVGGAFKGFSGDVIYQHATDAIHLGAYSAATTGVDLTQDLTATLANQDAWAFLAKYNYQAFTVYGVYSYARLSAPSDTSYPKGWQNVIGSDYTVLGTGVTGASVNTTAYKNAEILQAAMIGAKYSINPQLDLSGNYAHIWNNTFDTAPATNCVAYTTSPAGYNGTVPAGTKKSDCAGHLDAFGALLDYRPIKRLDVYGGVLFTKGTGGQVSGYWSDSNVAVTAGVRLTF